MSQLLLAFGAKEITITVVAVVGFLILLIGFLRKFSRMAWFGYQIAILFGLTLLMGKIPYDKIPFLANPVWRFVAMAGAFLLVCAIIMGIGMLVRRGFLKRAERNKARKKKSNLFVRFIDCLLGAITAVVNLAVILLIFAGPTLLVFDTLGLFSGYIGIVYENVVWQYLAGHVVDFLLIGFLVLALKSGYKLGVARSLWTILCLLLGIASFIGSIIAVWKLPFLQSLSATMVGAFSFSGSLAGILGFVSTVLICFLACIIVILLLNLLIGLIVKGIDRTGPLRLIDGVIMAIIFYVFALAIVLAFDLLVTYLSAGGLSVLLDGRFAFIADAFPYEAFVNSSPLNSFFYQNNLITFFLGW